MEDYENHLAHCFDLIAKKLSRGPIAAWGTRDFQILSESIHKETGTLLSISTLKRLSGKVNYTSKPNPTTLDVLAVYLGYSDWRTFVSQGKSDPIQKKKKSTTAKPLQYTKPLLMLALIMVTLLLMIYSKPVVNYDTNDFEFNAESVSTGIPNSVVFRYNAKAADKDAKVAIQQDWDKRKRVSVNREDSVSTSIYYWPGYFKSKLVVDDTIVKEKHILIPTEDWLGTIETDSLPIYLNKTAYQSENRLSTSVETLRSHGVNPLAKQTITGFYLVKDFGSIHTDEFNLSLSLKNNLQSGAIPCQAAQIQIMHEDGPISIVVSNKGCVSNISLFAFDTMIDGKKNDLSGFGVDMTKDVKLDCVSKDSKMDIRINDTSVFTLNVPQAPKKILGLSILFEGAGTVNQLVLRNNSGVVHSLGSNTIVRETQHNAITSERANLN